MISTGQMLTFGLVSLLIIVIPGPSVLFVVGRALAYGRPAVLPQFVDPSRGHVPVQMFLLGMIFTLIALLSDATWSVAAGTARNWFGRSPRRLRLVGGAGGLAMIGLGLSVAVTGRKD